jgi:hypothetical protein
MLEVDRRLSAKLAPIFPPSLIILYSYGYIDAEPPLWRQAASLVICFIKLKIPKNLRMTSYTLNKIGKFSITE